MPGQTLRVAVLAAGSQLAEYGAKEVVGPVDLRMLQKVGDCPSNLSRYRRWGPSRETIRRESTLRSEPAERPLLALCRYRGLLSPPRIAPTSLGEALQSWDVGWRR